MTDDDDPLRRFRAEVPPPGEAAWAAVRAAVVREIEAESERPRASPRATRRWSPRLLTAALAGLALTGAAAYGATTLIGVGAPAPNPPSPLTPSNIKLLGLRVADPDGGPPWGLRLALSRPLLGPQVPDGPRADVAIQIGRIRGSQMGFIGQDNVFHDDHLFHAAGPTSALITPANYSIAGTPQKPDLRAVYHFGLTLPGVASAYQGCSNVKVPARGLLPQRDIEREVRSLRRQLAILRADGAAARREARRLGLSVAALRAVVAENLGGMRERASGLVTERSFATCPGTDLRTIVFGFAGPDTASIAISGLGIHEAESLDADDDGFYLFVLPNRWSYASKFQATATCGDGRTVSGLAGPGNPDPPYCGAG
jgi:hypothetical protein